MFKNEKVVEVKTCKHCNSSFEITDKDLEFYEKVSPIFQDRKYSIPTPQLCPDCRQQRRLSFRNERKLYKRKCDATGKDIISMYSPENSNIVYEYDYWWSDKWNPLKYGKDFNFSRPFFNQFYELYNQAPKCHIEISPSENSIYTNQAGYNKNCYLIFEAGYNEDCIYGNSIWNSHNSVDNSFVNSTEQCYECLDVKKSFHVFFSQECDNCKNSLFLFDCHNCDNCIGCWNLSQKSYYILNKSVSKEIFEKIKNDLLNDLSKRVEFQVEFEKQKKISSICCSKRTLNNENVIGNNIFESKKCQGFDITGCQNIRYGYSVYLSSDCQDYAYWGNDAQKIYECLSVGNSVHSIGFSYTCYNSVSDLMYCQNCVNGTNNCFACVGLKQKQYCILNKQYTKEEYEKLVPQIIEHMMKTGEWGEFFPSSISPFGYNETVAQEYFPLTKEEALKKGFNWSDYEAQFPKVDKIIPANKLPDDISKIPDDILNWAIECEITKKPFRIIRGELEFYRKHNLPIPRRHPDQRHLDRMALRNPRKLFDRKCDKCGKNIKTTYSPDRSEIVYCEECYNKEVY